MRARREDFKWALVDGDRFLDDTDGVLLFETRKEARRWRNDWAKFYRQHEINRLPPMVVKVCVRVEEIKQVETVDEQGH